MGVEFHPRLLPISPILPATTFPAQITLGDSLTYGNDIPAHAWRNVLSARTGATANNASANGRTIAQMVSVYDIEVRPYLPVQTSAPAFVTILLGNNDFDLVTGEDAFAALTPLIQNSHNNGAYVFLLAVTAATARPTGSTWDNHRLVFNTLQRDAFRAKVVDYFFDTTIYLPNPADQTLFESDGTHYTQAGHARLGNALFDELTSFFSW